MLVRILLILQRLKIVFFYLLIDIISLVFNFNKLQKVTRQPRNTYGTVLSLQGKEIPVSFHPFSWRDIFRAYKGNEKGWVSGWIQRIRNRLRVSWFDKWCRGDIHPDEMQLSTTTETSAPLRLRWYLSERRCQSCISVWVINYDQSSGGDAETCFWA